MNEDKENTTVRITHVTLNLTANVGDDDCLLYIRVVPDGQDGAVVYARSLLPDEQDDGKPILLRPALGERLTFRPGAIRLSIEDADRLSKPEADGYRPITNTVWTWLRLWPVSNEGLFHYLLASARRLDGTHMLFADMKRVMNDVSGGFVALRGQFFHALSAAEILIVALGRSVNLLDGLANKFSAPVPLPTSIDSKRQTIRQLRNAFEHIDDRALGQVRGRPDPNALTVFDQRSFVQEGKLTYAEHNLSIDDDVIQMLIDGRQYIKDVTACFVGDAKQLNAPIHFFGSSPDGVASDGQQVKGSLCTGHRLGKTHVKASEFRFAVGTPNTSRSSVWKVWTRKSDIYIQSRMMGYSTKVSLHESGQCQWSMTSEWVRKAQPRNADRHMVRWRLQKPVGKQAIHVFRIAIPESELRQVETNKRLTRVRWITAPAEQAAIFVECYLTPPTGEAPHADLPYDHLASLRLADSRWFVLLAHEVPVPSDVVVRLAAARSEIIAMAQDAGIQPKPQYRAVGFVSFDDPNLKGMIELVPYQGI